MKLDWDDLRYFLAVIEHGSTKRAATALRVDQTTCARRIGGLEAALGLQLFDRDEGRYRPTRDALDLIEAAKAVGAAADRFREQASGRRRARSRTIRITGEETLSAAVIVPAVARFTRLHPDVQVEIDVSPQLRDLEAGEADIAIRGGLEPTAINVVRRKLADDPLGIYCSWTYPSPPVSPEDLPGHPIACLDGHMEQIDAAGLSSYVRHVANSMTALRAMIGEGSVVGPLDRFLAEAGPPLRLCFDLPFPSAIWLIYPERLRGSPDVRELGRLLAEQFRRVRTGTEPDRSER